MSPRRVSRTPPNPRDIYVHALYFLGTDGFLRKEVDKDEALMPMLQYPGMIISALSSELFFKSLIVHQGDDHRDMHDLSKLFNMLNDKNKTIVERHWNEGCLARKDLIDADEIRFARTIPRDLKTALSDCGQAFTLLRYVYERRQKPLFYITHLPISLRKAVEEVTGWIP